MLWSYPSPLVRGKLIKRYKRFFADVTLDSGEVVVAHCANTGSMRTCGEPLDPVYLLHAPSPTRKLAYSWELTETVGGFIGVHTGRPNALAAAAQRHGRIPELAGYSSQRSEVKYGASSRIDLLLESLDLPDCYVEVKNATLFANDQVLFPDAVTERGRKHLAELAAVAKSGKRAVNLFLLNRPEGRVFAPAKSIDPDYARDLSRVSREGVEILAYRVHATPYGLDIGGSVEVEL